MLKKNIKLEILTLTEEKLRDNFASILLIDRLRLKKFEMWSIKNFFMLREKKYHMSQIALGEEKPVGFLIASKDGETCLIHRIAVQEAYGRMGIGSKMFTRMEEKARENDCQKIVVGPTLKDNKYAHFYLKNGFQIMSPVEQRKFFQSKGLKGIRILTDYLTFYKFLKPKESHGRESNEKNFTNSQEKKP